MLRNKLLNFSPKMAFQSTAITVAVAVIILNFLSGGWVFNQIGESFTGESGAFLTDQVKCGIGVLLAPPFMKIMGFTVPLPTADDILVAALLTILFGTVINQFHPLDWRWWLLLFLVMWAIVKIVAIWLVVSTPGCKDLVVMPYEFFEPIHMIQIMLVPLVLWKVLTWRK